MAIKKNYSYFVLLLAVLLGCKAISKHLTNWKMLDDSALENPLQAIGGDGIIFAPPANDHPLEPDQLAKEKEQQLLAYYSPVIIQQRGGGEGKKHTYPREFDLVGEAKLKREANGKLKSYVTGHPTVYGIFQRVPIGGTEKIQLTYTAWYPAHPKMKTIDLEEADIDSMVLRVTLNSNYTPIFYETIAACGCFHKVFVPHWVETQAAQEYGAPEKGKKYVIEKTMKRSIDWEIGDLVEEDPLHPRRPVVFVSAGEHKVIKLGSRSKLKIPENTDVVNYTLKDYSALYSIPVDGEKEAAAFFDMKDGGKVRGAERKERFLMGLVGVDSAGQPRANDQIKLHFDQSTWGDPNIYQTYLRLPSGLLK